MKSEPCPPHPIRDMPGRRSTAGPELTNLDRGGNVRLNTGVRLKMRWGRRDADRTEKRERVPMEKKLTMVYWKGDKFWLGKLLEHPEIMTQGETLEELEENLKDAYRLMVMEDVPDSYEVKEIAL